jgi:hypothetical protein
MPLTKVQSAMIGSIDATSLTGVVPAANGGTGGTGGVVDMKNRIINGAFNVWQRGTSFTSVSSGQYTADRWQISYRTAGVTVAQQNNTTYYACRLTNTDGSVQSFDFEQRIEDVTQFNNASFTMSFNAKASTASTVTAQVYVNYGSGGSSQDTVYVGNVSVTTTRTGFTIALPFPNMASKTIGANNYVRVLLSPSSLAASGWVEYDSVQIEAGTVATNFDFRSYGTELALCQRYFIQTEQYGQSTGGAPTMTSYIGFNTTAFNWFWHSVSFPTTMRTSATVTTSDFNGNTGKISIWTSTGGATSFNITPYTLYATRDGFSYSDYNNSKYGIGIGGYIASAEL